MYYRKWRNNPARIQEYATLDAAMKDTNTTFTKEVFKGELELIGVITTTMKPTLVLEAADGPKKKVDVLDRDDSDDEEGEEESD